MAREGVVPTVFDPEEIRMINCPRGGWQEGQLSRLAADFEEFLYVFAPAGFYDDLVLRMKLHMNKLEYHEALERVRRIAKGE